MFSFHDNLHYLKRNLRQILMLKTSTSLLQSLYNFIIYQKNATMLTSLFIKNFEKTVRR